RRAAISVSVLLRYSLKRLRYCPVAAAPAAKPDETMSAKARVSRVKRGMVRSVEAAFFVQFSRPVHELSILQLQDDGLGDGDVLRREGRLQHGPRLTGDHINGGHFGHGRSDHPLRGEHVEVIH